MLPRHLLVIGLLCALAACGGGGSPGPVPPAASLPVVDTSPVAQADPGSTLPANWRTGVFMEIYVRGYKDSDGDGIGDLKGLTQSLDYLQGLGISGIWLMPVTRSQDRDHGYAVSDYRSIEPDYGSLADMDELLRQAHARGIGVVIDYVMNHSAQAHPAFVNSASSASSPYRDWYVWQASRPTGWAIYGGDPWRSAATGHYYAPFSTQMPDFNLRQADVLAWHQHNMRFWLNRGVDGLRFDAVGNLLENGPAAWENQPENHKLMAATRAMMNSYAQRYLVCEGPADSTGYATSCGAAFAFGHQHNIVNAAKGNTAAVAAVASYFNTAPAGMATLVSNHDAFAGQRLHDQVAGNLLQYKLAAATYLLQPGTPFIYYGEEVGMAGAASLSGDHKLRTPMSWAGDATRAGFTTGTPFRALAANVATNNVAVQAADPDSLLSHYKALIALRKTVPALAQGAYDNAAANGTVLSFRRTLGGQRAVVVINYGTAAATAAVAGLPAAATLARAYPAAGAGVNVDGSGSASIAMSAQAVVVFTY